MSNKAEGQSTACADERVLISIKQPTQKNINLGLLWIIFSLAIFMIWDEIKFSATDALAEKLLVGTVNLSMFLAGVYFIVVALFHESLQENKLIIKDGKLCTNLNVFGTTLFSKREKIELSLDALSVDGVKEGGSKFDYFSHTKILLNDGEQWVVIKIATSTEEEIQQLVEDIKDSIPL